MHAKEPLCLCGLPGNHRALQRLSQRLVTFASAQSTPPHRFLSRWRPAFKETVNPEPGQTNQSGSGGGRERFITGRAKQLLYLGELLLLFCLIEFSGRDASEPQIYHILKLAQTRSMKDACGTFNPLYAVRRARSHCWTYPAVQPCPSGSGPPSRNSSCSWARHPPPAAAPPVTADGNIIWNQRSLNAAQHM